MMSYSHTPVTATVNKSTSRFAPKAVPRKPLTAVPVKSTPTVTIHERSGSEDDGGETDLESRGESLEDETEQSKVEQKTAAIPIIQPSISSSEDSPSRAEPPLPTTSLSTRVLRSTAPVVEPTPSTSAAPVPNSPTLSTTAPKRRRASTAETTRRTRRKNTPPAAEQVVISPATTKMSEMCIDKRTGRKSSRYAELREAERQRRKERELKREQAAAGIPETLTPITLPNPAFMDLNTSAVEEDDTLAPATHSTARVMTDAEGNLVLDQSSLQVNRHAIHPSTLTDTLVHTTESIFSSKTNSATYASTRMHASNTIRWLPDDNERFYLALRMFGTDFTMVASYLGGGKNRRHIKNKFYREEKLNSDKLTWALKNRLEVDKAGLEEKRGSALQPSDELKEELEKIKNEAAVIKAMPRFSEMQESGIESTEPARGPTIISSHLDRDDSDI